METKGKEEAKGIVGGYKRPVFTRNDVSRGVGEDGSNEICTGKHTEADDSNKTRTETHAKGRPTPILGEDLTMTFARDLEGENGNNRTLNG